MKIAVFHNFMDNIGGAEVVDLTLARELGADIYTTNIDREKIEKMGFSTKNIFSIGRVPINAPWKQEFSYWKFRKLKLERRYDFYIIAGDWAMAGAIHNKPNFWYVFSPMREIFDLYSYVRRESVPRWQRLIFDLWVLGRRLLIKQDAAKIENIASISENVRDRVKKYLIKDSAVIYPPVDTARYRHEKNGNYWLSVNRLIGHKRIDLQIAAFKKMPDQRLLIVGSYERSKHFRRYADYIKRIKSRNVDIISWASQEELIELYANCLGFITTAKDEDFGLTAVEAMAAGKPVIAPDEGGYKETVINGLTGRLIEDIDADKLVSAIKEISQNPEKYKKACLEQAKKFDKEIFVKKIKEQIEKISNME
ncbi:glycosyltransferase [Candidatus Falkowbacteria bacterium]|nr:glycosyltransferase [Candidatus Falkowbacteria bacterium]